MGINVAQILNKEHGQDIILIAGAIDLTAEAIAGVPESFFNILLGGHVYLPSFVLS
jgi:hypothetical protein